MGGFMKQGRICILTSGRFAGKKAIIVSQHDSRANRQFPHAVVAGIERHPKRVTRRMGKKRIARKSHIKPFLKAVNLSHLLPTRYVVKDFEFEGINDNILKEKEQKAEAKKTLRQVFEKKYLHPSSAEDKGENTKFFFKKLRF